MANRKRRVNTRRLVRKLVARGDIDGLVRWAKDEPNAAAALVTRVFELDDTKRWWAIVALGRVSGQMAANGDLEGVRKVVRQLFWLMNDESGGIAWHGPEAIAEILTNVPSLVSEYGRIVASSINEDPFGPGAHWAVARLASFEPEQFHHVEPQLVESLTADDPWLRGYALTALDVLQPERARERAEALLADRSPLAVHDSATASVSTTTVGEIAARLLEPERRPSSDALSSKDAPSSQNSGLSELDSVN